MHGLGFVLMRGGMWAEEVVPQTQPEPRWAARIQYLNTSEMEQRSAASRAASEKLFKQPQAKELLESEPNRADTSQRLLGHDIFLMHYTRHKYCYKIQLIRYLTWHFRKCAFTNVAYVDPNMESIFEFNNLRFSPEMFCHISVIRMIAA